MYNLLHKVLLNENTKINKNNLLDVIEEVNSYKDSEIIDYINATVGHIIRMDIQDKYIIVKENISSSNHSNVSNIIKDVFWEECSVIKYSKDNGIELKEIKENSVILIIDDYIGSGKTIIDILKHIEKSYRNQNIKIVSYIWQEKAIEKINEYIYEEEKNNKYEDSEILKYIEKTCDTCNNNKYKFGYNNKL